MLKIEIRRLGNAAFEDNGRTNELRAVLEAMLQSLDEGETRGVLRDSNGNTVGNYRIAKD
jgi:hypothetical protein